MLTVFTHYYTYQKMHSINLSVEKLLATAHSGASIPGSGETPSNNSLRHT